MRKLFAGDCLDVLNDPSRIDDKSVDLVYLDPPFNSQSTYNLPFDREKAFKDLRPVMAFEDTWHWSENEVDVLDRLERGGGYSDKIIARIVQVVRDIYKERGTGNSMGAYLLNMAIRLKAMKRVIKDTGSIYLHCDPTASHYLKMLMDSIFGANNFRNELIWRIGWVSGYKTQKKGWIRNHDTILYYLMSDEAKMRFNKEYLPYPEGYTRRDGSKPTGKGFPIEDTWNCSNGDILDSMMIKSFSKEKLGYPTQKTLKLLERIVRASSNEGELVLDPFCGCGTTVHAAESLGRNWIGVDISKFSIGLIKNRILHNFQELKTEDISVRGSVMSLQDAIDLAKQDKFEFEKWVCGEIGATGMYHDPGDKGADGGVDGIIPFYHSESIFQKTAETTYAIVQVKGGHVSVNDVKALSTTVRERKGKCGVIVCFEKYKKTVENQREKLMIKDAIGDFPFVQGLTVEQLIRGDSVNLPGYKKVA